MLRFPLWLERVSAVIAIGVMVAAPLPFGSVETFWISLWCALMALSVLLALPATTTHLARRDILCALLAFAAFFVAVRLQALPGMWEPGGLRRSAAEMLQRPTRTDVAADVGGLFWALGPSLLFTLTFVRFRMLARSRDRGRLVLLAFGGAAVVYALYGLLARVVFPDALLWRSKIYYTDFLTATFVNRNTAASYFGAATIVWLMLLLPMLRLAFVKGLSLRNAIWLSFKGLDRKMIGCAAAAMLCLIAVVATGSRAGSGLTLIGAACASLLYFWPRRGGERLSLAYLMIPAVVAALALAVSAGAVGTRLDSRGLSDEGRLSVYRQAVGLIAERPLLGYGLGSFSTVFPGVRPDDLSSVGIWDRAHSTPLELSLDVGLPAAGAVAIACLLFTWLLAKAAFQRRTSITICGLTVGMMGLVHSVVDFSLQIPGYAVCFAALTATALAQRGSRRATMTGASERPQELS